MRTKSEFSFLVGGRSHILRDSFHLAVRGGRGESQHPGMRNGRMDRGRDFCF